MTKWPKVKLGDVCTAQVSNISQKDILENTGNYPVYGASGFIRNIDFYEQTNTYIGIVKDGAGVGRVCLLPPYSSLISTMQYIIPNENIDPTYLCAVLDHLKLARFSTGATIPHIYFKNYKDLSLPLPPLMEQKRIAENLDRVQTLLSQRREQLTHLDQLTRSYFLHLFGDPVTNPKGWEVYCLGELGELNRGISKHRPRNAPELLGGPYPLIQTGEVANSGMYLREYHNTYSELGLSQSKMWPAGTLCITIAANIAQTAILSFDACFPDSVVGFVSSDKVTQIYIYFWFLFFQKILDEQAPQVAQKNINLKILSELEVMTPPIDLQNQFSDFVRKLETQRNLIQSGITDLETAYASMMQRYFG